MTHAEPIRSTTWERESPRARGQRVWREPAWVVAGVVGCLILAWTAIIFLVDRARFVVLSPELQAGVEAASVFARLFGALVLFLFPVERLETRLRWIASGIALLGIGGFLFGYLPPLFETPLSVSEAVYISNTIWSGAAVLFLIGLLPARPPVASGRMLAAITGGMSVLLVGLLLARNVLPSLVEVESLEVAATHDLTYLSGLTGWYWPLALTTLVLSLVTLVAAARRHAEELVGSWLVLAMTLFAGSQLHNLFWPSVYSPVLTTSSLLRLTFAAVVAVAGVIGLRQVATERGRLAAERAVLLDTSKEYGRRLTELAVLKADFTAMVAHELGGPIAAVRRCADALGSGLLDRAGQRRTLDVVQSEVDLLATLVADVQAIAAVERDDFVVQPLPIPIGALVADALAFAETLPGDHPVTIERMLDRVRADPERIGQVLRNLLANAAKYSPDRAPITIRIEARDERLVQIEVADCGYGIHPDDMERIFEKFGRGRDRLGRQQHGVGLGLYVSRRIVKAHGSELVARSSLGEGSVFRFTLERIG